MEQTGKMVEVIVKYSGDIAQIAQRIEGTQVVELLNEYAVLKVDAGAVDELESQPEIEYVERPVRLYFTDIEGSGASCITALQRPAAQSGLSLYGDGVLVGIVDSGIDFTHPDFRDPDGMSRIAWLWDQTISPQKLSGEAIPAQPPNGYVIGAEYDNAKINEALQKEGTAAVYRALPSRDLAGVAPKSTLIVVKLASPEEDSFPSTSELLQAVNYCVSKALSMRMPLALNLSFGNTYGSHAPCN
jgi:subtilisin family serine protease